MSFGRTFWRSSDSRWCWCHSASGVSGNNLDDKQMTIRYSAVIWLALGAILQAQALGVAVAWMERRAAILVVALAAALMLGVYWLAPGTAVIGAHPLPLVPALLVAACAVAAGALILVALASAASRRLAQIG